MNAIWLKDKARHLRVSQAQTIKLNPIWYFLFAEWIEDRYSRILILHAANYLKFCNYDLSIVFRWLYAQVPSLW